MTRERLSTSSSKPAEDVGASNSPANPNRSAQTTEQKGDDAGRLMARNAHLKFPVAALAALSLVCAFELGYVRHYRYRFWDSTYSLAELKRKALTSDKPPDDVAVFGTSRFYHVDPAQISDTFGPGTRVTNYAWAWCGMEIYEAMLQGLINAGRTPKAILVDGMPELFGYRPDLLSIGGDPANISRYSNTAPLGAAVTVEAGQSLWRPLWDTVSSRITPPSIGYGERVRKGVKRLIKDRKAPKPRQDFDTFVGAWQRQGWLQFGPERTALYQEFEQVEKVNGPYVLYNNAHALKSYERFIRLANDHNIPVMLVAVPSNPLMAQRYKANGVYRAYEQWLDNMEKKYPVFNAPSPRWLDWPESMADAGHLNSSGIKRHMGFIKERLREQLARQ